MYFLLKWCISYQLKVCKRKNWCDVGYPMWHRLNLDPGTKRSLISCPTVYQYGYPKQCSAL